MARKHIAAALSELQNICSSSAFLSFGQTPDSSIESKERGSTASGRVAIGFDESVNRRLLAPTPPRSINILSWGDVSSSNLSCVSSNEHYCLFSRLWFETRLEGFNLFSLLFLFQTLAYFEKLLQDLDRICCLPMTLGLEEIMQFVVDYQKLKPDLFARARLQVL